MRPEDLFDRIGEVDERYVTDARRKKRKRTWIPVSAVAATLALVLLVSALFQPWGSPSLNGDETTGHDGPSFHYNPAICGHFLLTTGHYPTRSQMPSENLMNENYEQWEEEERVWFEENCARREAFYELEELPRDFFALLIQTMLKGSGGENTLCSPINIYMALAMLAETVEGESRQEILNVLGAKGIEELRITAGTIWNAHYCNDGAVASILASSVWLDKDISYVKETLERIAELYCAPSFRGEMGSEEYNEALRAWINAQTGGVLTDQLETLEMYPETVLALATTVYYSARWQSAFDASKNDRRVFHGSRGDVLSAYMNRVAAGDYYYGAEYTAAALPFAEGGSMYFILPDEGKTVDDVLTGTDFYTLLEELSTSESLKYCEIEMHVPRFDVSSQRELSDALRDMGITSVFSAERADFSPIFGEDFGGVALSEVQHGVRVSIDEEGVEAAAYTVMLDAGSGPPQEKVEFTLDRPFLFVIVSDVGLPLFVGVVNNLQ